MWYMRYACVMVQLTHWNDISDSVSHKTNGCCRRHQFMLAELLWIIPSQELRICLRRFYQFLWTSDRTWIRSSPRYTDGYFLRIVRSCHYSGVYSNILRISPSELGNPPIQIATSRNSRIVWKEFTSSRSKETALHQEWGALSTLNLALLPILHILLG